MNDIFKRMISNYVLDSQGCTLIKLITELASIIYSHNITQLINEDNSFQLLRMLEFYEGEHIRSPEHLHAFITNLIQEMIDNEELVTIKYVLPNLQYREKMYIFPKGTQIIK